MRWGPLLLAALLAACAGTPQTAGGEGRAQITWLSYVGGEDLRAACEPGAPDRFRMILNAVDGPALHTYDVLQEPDGALLRVRSIPVADLARIPAHAPLDTWPAKQASIRLDRTQFQELVTRLLEVGAGRPVPGPTLSGSGWLVNGCHDGAYFSIFLPRAGESWEPAGLSGATP